MGAIPYALSISHFVSSVGADAGFAAIIGLAILILLYFAQARETASLRDRFTEAAEQVRRLELQVAHLSRPSAAAQGQPAGQAAVAPRPAAAQAAAVPSRVARVLPVSEVPMAPAGVGAPALSAATRMVPSGDEGAISIRPGAARVAAAAGAAGAAGAAVASGDDSGQAGAASGGGGVMAPPAPSGPTGPASPGPAPATAAAAAAGTGAATGARANGGSNPPSGRTPAPAPASGGGLPPRTGQGPSRPYRIAGARSPGQPAPRQAPPPATPKRSGLRKALLTIAGLLVVAAIAAGLVIITSSDSNSAHTAGSGTSADSNAPSANRHHKAKAAALKPSQVTVAVLNGTATSNLAHDVSQKLTGAGYKPGMIATATDQTQAATTVGYMPGQRRAAVIVARSLNLGSTAIEPLTASNRAVACPQAACAAQVVVTVGADLSSDASSSSAAPSTTAAGTTT
ncbi:MAG TPA: LytR C-terminal domain-containing protein [Solirubrobacteraceae bacterium]